MFPKDTWVKYDDELRKVAEPIIGQEEVEELKGIQGMKSSKKVNTAQYGYFQTTSNTDMHTA